jgi:arylsulfatase A-like enzyme
VPLLVIAPGRVPSGQVASTPVSLRDLPATVVDLVGVRRESSFPGRSLARFWAAGATGDQSLADPVFAEFEDAQLPANEKTNPWRSLAVGDMVYIRNAGGDEELYDIAADPGEAHNLAASADAGPALERLRGALDRFLADQAHPAPGPSANP